MKTKIAMKENGTAEILIYDTIGDGWLGGISAKEFISDLRKIDSKAPLDVRIHSEGGSVFDGVAIYNSLVSHQGKVSVYIDGVALSIASLIAMSGDEINIAENGWMMIHDPWGVFSGTAADLREQATLMDKIREQLVNTYEKRAPDTDIDGLMSAETWFNADEAKAAGLVDSITNEMKMVAHSDYGKFKHAPDALKNNSNTLINVVKNNNQGENTARGEALRYMSVRTGRLTK